MSARYKAAEKLRERLQRVHATVRTGTVSMSIDTRDLLPILDEYLAVCPPARALHDTHEAWHAILPADESNPMELQRSGTLFAAMRDAETDLAAALNETYGTDET